MFVAFVSRSGLCATVVEHAIENDSVCLSEFILDELGRTLLTKSKLSAATVADLIEFLSIETSLVTPAAIDPDVCRDPSDAAILGTAVAAGAEGLVTDQIYYRWRKEYGGLKVDQAKRFKELERENARLRRLLADAELDKAILREAARPNC